MEPNSYGTMHKQRKPLTRRAAFLIIALIVAIGLIFGGVQLYRFLNRKTVTLKPTTGLTMAIGLPTDNEESLGIEKIILSTTSEQSVKVAPGYYAIQISGKGYNTAVTALTVEEDMTVTPPDPSYTPEKLKEMYLEQKSAISAAIPQVANGSYTISDDQSSLYDVGEWFGGRLLPKNTAVDDQLVVVLRKVDNQWKLVAGPSMVISIKQYPDIPSNVLRTINNNYKVEINEGIE